MPKKPWFKVRRLGDRVIGVSATGYDRNIGKKNEEKLEIFLTAMTGTGPSKQARDLVDKLNAVVAWHYGEGDGH